MAMSTRRANWAQYIDVRSNGTSLFHDVCLERVKRAFPELRFERQGETEAWFRASVPDTPLSFTVYADGVGLYGPDVDDRFEYQDFESPDELIAKAIEHIHRALPSNP